MKEFFNIYEQKNIIKESSFDKEALWPTGKKRKRIKDRGIKWVETYHERSEPLKKRFTKDIGEGSYYRYEGHDYWTDSDYFIVIGPSVKRGRKMFFAGIKKLPPKRERGIKKTYAPSGFYFSNILSAISFASSKWGAPFPRNQHNYSVNDLLNVNIPRKIRG